MATSEPAASSSASSVRTLFPVRGDEQREASRDEDPLTPGEVEEASCLSSIAERSLDLKKRVDSLRQEDFQGRIKQFAQDFKRTFYPLYARYNQTKYDLLNVSTDSSGSESSLGGGDSPITTLEKEIEVRFQQLVERYSDLPISPHFMRRMFRHSVDEPSAEFGLSFHYYQAQLIHSIINQREYLQQVEEDIARCKRGILHDFFPDKQMDYDQMHPEVVPFVADGHLGGRCPVKVTFTSPELPGESFSVVYKPRSAHMDQKIIETFGKINACNEKGSERELPVYQIRNYGDHFSVWEFIEGQTPHVDGVDNCVELLPSPGEVKQAIKRRGLRLEAVCREMGISDLHRENFIIRGQYIVPIDLENLQPGQGTGLYDQATPIPEELQLSREEKALIETFSREARETEFRLVPIGTGILEGMKDNPDKLEKAFEEVVMQTFSKGDIRLSIDRTEFKHLILTDLMNNDIPYFIQRGDNILYLTKEGTVPIGEKLVGQQ